MFRLEELVAGVRSLRLVTGRNVIRRAFDLSIRTVSPRVRHHDTVVARDDRRELPRSSANAAPRVASIRSRQQQQQRRVKQQREQVRYETSLRPTALSPESSAQNGSRRIHPCLAGNGQSHSARTLCLVTNRVNSSRQGQRTSALFRVGWDSSLRAPAHHRGASSNHGGPARRCATGPNLPPNRTWALERPASRVRHCDQNSIFRVCFSRSSRDSTWIVSRTRVEPPGTGIRNSTAPSFTGNLSVVLNLMICL